MESVRACLAERDRELEEMKGALAERDRHIKEVELKLLSATQQMAANAGDYAQHMKEKDEELEQYKVCASWLLHRYPLDSHPTHSPGS